MMEDLARWFPLRHFALCADGFYAPLAGKNLPRTHITSRLRRDATLFAPLSPTRHRKCVAADQRPPAHQKAAQYCRSWQKATVNRRGKLLHRFVYNQQVLWHLLFLSPHHSHG